MSYLLCKCQKSGQMSKNVTNQHAHKSPPEIKMPLTRNLYELDEVVSALQTCLLRGWPRAAFWTCELVLSGEEALAVRTLKDIWYRRGGGYDPTLLTDPILWSRCVRVQAAIRAAGSLNAARFLSLTATMADRPTMTPLPKTQEIQNRRTASAAAWLATLAAEETINRDEAAGWWISYDAACRQQSRTDSIWLLQAVQPLLSADAIWAAIHQASRGSAATKAALNLLCETASAHPLDQALAQANATLLLCTPTEQRESVLLQKPTDLPSYKRDWQTWTDQAGRRAARIHDIPAEALHAATTRGSLPRKYTNIADVRDPVALLVEGCAFWRSATAAAGIVYDPETETIEFPDDDVLEDFYQRYFPDDIPDEWPSAYQERSHGRGCQETARSPDPDPPVREEPISRRAWLSATHVRQKT
jgi:hypothetical protein